jgi:hypothetical protein
MSPFVAAMAVWGLLMALLSVRPVRASELADDHPSVLFHSHNDYEQTHPLYDALKNHFTSVEADLYLKQREIQVSHNGWWGVKGRLRDLYLEPLQKLVNEHGSVYGDGQPFYLWLDLKQGSKELRMKLEELLANYPMLTVFSRDGVRQQGAVIAILTGDRDSKTAYMDQFSIRRTCRDSNHFRPRDPPADNGWLWYSLKWSDYFDWNGRDGMPPPERRRLAELVRTIHEKGRRIRFWNTPETKDLWRELTAAQVDMIGTDQLAQIAQFFQQRVALKQ